MAAVIEDAGFDFERRILRGLAAEWQCAAGMLRHAHGHVLECPGFELRDLTNAWAQWMPEKRLMVFSRRLIREHSWLAARAVLLHETAHQLSGLLPGNDHAPHGPLFRQACLMLGADPAAAARLDRPDVPPAPEPAGRPERMLLRARKLLALAQSANRHEAENAMAKARALIAKYNLELAENTDPEDYTGICVGRPALRHSSADYSLAALLAEFYFVQAIWVPAYVMEKDRMGSVLEICGTASNLSMAGYAHDFLQRAIGEQWTAFVRGRPAAARRKTDFALGLLHGFSEKLRRQEQNWQKTSPTACALIRREEIKLRRYMRLRHPRQRTASSRRLMPDWNVHQAGIEAGHRTIMARPISSPGAGNARGNPRRQLGNGQPLLPH